MNKLVLAILLLHFQFSEAQNYVGVNGYGNLRLNKNNTYIFEYWDCGQDSGNYVLNGDTLILSSNIKQLEIKERNVFDENFFFFNFLSSMKIYSSNCITLEKNGLIDSLSQLMYVSNIDLKKGDLIEFSLFGAPRKYFWQEDNIKSCLIELDLRLHRKIYFDKYPLLMCKNYLLPFVEKDNNTFRQINDFEFLSMKKTNKKSYKHRKSGFVIY